MRAIYSAYLIEDIEGVHANPTPIACSFDGNSVRVAALAEHSKTKKPVLFVQTSHMAISHVEIIGTLHPLGVENMALRPVLALEGWRLALHLRYGQDWAYIGNPYGKNSMPLENVVPGLQRAS